VMLLKTSLVGIPDPEDDGLFIQQPRRFESSDEHMSLTVSGIWNTYQNISVKIKELQQHTPTHMLTVLTHSGV